MDSIIFDLDGTIWDPIDTVLKAWNHCIKKHSQIKRELTRTDFEGTMGLQMPEISKKLFPYLSEDFRAQVIAECCQAESEYIKQYGGKLYPHVVSHKYLSNLIEQTYIKGNIRYGIKQLAKDGELAEFNGNSRL